MRDACDLRAVFIGQDNFLAAVFQSVANAPIVGIDGDVESRWRTAAEEDDVRAGGDCRAGRELEVGGQRRGVAQPPVA